MNKSYLLLLMVFVVGLLLVGTISAADWDNKLKYSNNNLKVDFKNSFLGIIPTSDLGSVELKSHKSVEEVRKLGAGENQAVMFYDFNDWKLYEDGLGEVIFIDMNTGEEIEKDYYFAELTTEQQPKYKTVCEDKLSNNGSIYPECSEIQNGFKQVEVWKRLETNDIPKGKITIGLITDVEVGDYIDAVWTIAGKKVKKHASWTQDLNTDIYLYFKYDTTAITIDSVAGLNTSTTASNVTGKIGNAYEHDGSEVTGTAGYKPYVASINEGSINFWIKTVDSEFSAFSQDGSGEINNVDTQIGSGGGAAVSPFCGAGNFCMSINRVVTVTTSASNIDDGDWHMVTITVDGTTHRLYVDGLNVDNTTTGDNIFGGDGGNFGFVFGSVLAGTLDAVGVWNRSLTAGEILINLFNEDNGNTYTTVFFPTVALNSPIDFFNTTNPTITFNGTISDIIPVNVSLIIDDVYNETNTSGDLGDYIFTKILSEGIHTWNYEACNADGCNNGTARNLTIDTISPEITIINPEEITYITEPIPFEVSGNENLDTCLYTLDDWVTNQTMTEINSTLFQFNQSGLADAQYTSKFFCNDTAGNINDTESVTFTFDTLQSNLIFPDNASTTFQIPNNFTCQGVSVTEIQNISLYTDEAGFGVVETIHLNQTTYYLDVYADSLSNSTSVNNVSFFNIAEGVWRVNSTESDYNTSRGQVIKTLFWGASTYDPRVLDFTNVVRIVSQDPREEDVNAFYFVFSKSPAQSGSSESAAYFTETTSNHISSWVKLTATSPSDPTYFRYLQPAFTTGSLIRREATAPVTSTNITLGTNLSDEYENQLNFSVHSLAGVGESSLGELVFLSKGTIENFTTLSGEAWASENLVYYNDNHSIPAMSFGGLNNLTINITHDVPSNITWTCEVCTNSSCEFANENRTLFLDNIPPTITITSPIEQIDLHSIGDSLFLNWTIVDINLDACWYQYNNTNTTVTCNDNTTSFNTVDGEQSIILYANDTIGNENSNSTSWTYAFLETGVAFDGNASETSRQSFEINVTTEITVLSISALLNYNGTNHTSTASCTSGNCTIINTIDIDLVTAGESELHDFFWDLTIFNGTDSISITTSTREQNVSRIHLEKCDATFTTQSLNFTAYDEQNLTRLSTFRFDGAFEQWTGAGTIRRETSFTNSSLSELNLCVLPTDETFFIDAIIEYDESGNESIYTLRNYFFQNDTINNVSQDIFLYLLKSSASTSFILKVQDDSLLPVAGVLVEINRFYPGTDEFRVVQIAKTDDSGKSVGFFETEIVDYKFFITLDNETLLETGIQKVIPESSPFTLTFNIGDPLGAPWATQEELEDLNSTLVWNDTSGFVTYIYIDSSSSFNLARLLVIKQDLANATNDTTICNENSTLTSATLFCNVGTTNGFYVASAFITRSSTEDLDKQITFQVETLSGVVGLLGLFFGWFLILIAAFMFKFNEIAGIWAITITVFLVNIIGLIKFGGVFVTATIAIAMLLTWIMER